MTSKMKTRPQVLVRELRRSVYLKMKGYNSTETTYKHKLLKDILYNERSNLVANFKDFLIFDDSTEFLKRSSLIYFAGFTLRKRQLVVFLKYLISMKSTLRYFLTISS